MNVDLRFGCPFNMLTKEDADSSFWRAAEFENRNVFGVKSVFTDVRKSTRFTITDLIEIYIINLY